jgi:adenylate cyclase, class 2
MRTPADNLEIEVKFFIADEQDACRRLITLGATARPRVFESNLRYEDSRNSLKASGQLLRLRRDQSCRLTYKCRPALPDTECKVLRELEVEVADFDAMAGILEALGYRRIQIYEKWRRTFAWRDVELCLDVMPFGTFLEIEGPKPGIKATAKQLGLAWEDRILANYLAIFDLLRQTFDLPFNDVTFADFEHYPVDITPLLGKLQAGHKTPVRSIRSAP